MKTIVYTLKTRPISPTWCHILHTFLWWMHRKLGICTWVKYTGDTKCFYDILKGFSKWIIILYEGPQAPVRLVNLGFGWILERFSCFCICLSVLFSNFNVFGIWSGSGIKTRQWKAISSLDLRTKAILAKF